MSPPVERYVRCSVDCDGELTVEPGLQYEDGDDLGMLVSRLRHVVAVALQHARHEVPRYDWQFGYFRAISDRIEDKLRNEGERKLRVEGRQEATWILMDYGDVLVHVMAAEQRAFYNLEELWSEAPRMELELLPV